MCGTRGSLRTMHGGGSAPSCCAFTHRVAFEEGSGPRIGKDSDAGRDWGQEQKGMTEDEMAVWHHRLNGPRGEALFRCARPSGVPRGPATSTAKDGEAL